MRRCVLITGSGGQLAAELAVEFTQADYDVVTLDRLTLDIAQPEAMEHVVTAYRPALILNAAAYNAVDRAEDEPTQAFAVNGLGPRSMARVAHALEGTVLVHYSTDYVFDGQLTRPYQEDDLPHPLSVYGVSKLAGEHFVLSSAPRSFVLRTGVVFGPAGQRTAHGNFVERMLALAAAGQTLRVVTDQIVSPTYAPDIARVTRTVVEAGFPFGLYHCVGQGSCSFYEFAQGIFSAAGVPADLYQTTSAAYNARASRPAFSVLGNTRLASVGVRTPRSWREALPEYLQRRRCP